jgi:hypothetical protein
MKYGYTSMILVIGAFMALPAIESVGARLPVSA